MRRFTYTALPGRVVVGAGAARERLAGEPERLGASPIASLMAAEAGGHPRPVEEKDVRELLEAAFAGRRP